MSCVCCCAGVLASGHDGTDTTTKTEEYNGTSWTEVNTSSTQGYGGHGAGTLTAGLFRLGRAGPSPSYANSAATEEYDGTNWTSGGTGLTARRNTAGGGTLTSAITFSGYIDSPSGTAFTEGYDGTSWSTRPNIGTARYGAAGATQGPNTAGLLIAGMNPNESNATEEFTGETSADTASTIDFD